MWIIKSGVIVVEEKNKSTKMPTSRKNSPIVQMQEIYKTQKLTDKI